MFETWELIDDYKKVINGHNKLLQTPPLFGSPQNSLTIELKGTYTYKWDIHINPEHIQIGIKISHNLRKEIPFLRIDYGGRHRNPTTDISNICTIINKYKGFEFKIDTPHVHIYIEGFNDKWAVPISELSKLYKLYGQRNISFHFPIQPIKTSKDLFQLFDNFAILSNIDI